MISQRSASACNWKYHAFQPPGCPFPHHAPPARSKSCFILTIPTLRDNFPSGISVISMQLMFLGLPWQLHPFALVRGCERWRGECNQLGLWTRQSKRAVDGGLGRAGVRWRRGTLPDGRKVFAGSTADGEPTR